MRRFNPRSVPSRVKLKTTIPACSSLSCFTKDADKNSSRISSGISRGNDLTPSCVVNATSRPALSFTKTVSLPSGVAASLRVPPDQITICGFTGGPERWRKIRLDGSKPPFTFIRRVLAALAGMLRYGTGKPYALFFGKALGFIVNYSPDKRSAAVSGGNYWKCS